MVMLGPILARVIEPLVAAVSRRSRKARSGRPGPAKVK